jgi:hypothetical protein
MVLVEAPAVAATGIAAAAAQAPSLESPTTKSAAPVAPKTKATTATASAAASSPVAAPPPLPPRGELDLPSLADDLALHSASDMPTESIESASFWQSIMAHGREWQMFAAGAVVGILLGMTVWVVASRSLTTELSEPESSLDETELATIATEAEPAVDIEQAPIADAVAVPPAPAEQPENEVKTPDAVKSPSPQVVKALKPILEEPSPADDFPALPAENAEAATEPEPTANTKPANVQAAATDLPDADKVVPPLGTVDSQVAARLAVRIPKLAFQRVPLRQFVGFLSELTGVRMLVDSNSLQSAGIKPPLVNVRADDVSVEELLQKLSRDYGLAWTEEAGIIVVRAR